MFFSSSSKGTSEMLVSYLLTELYRNYPPATVYTTHPFAFFFQSSDSPLVQFSTPTLPCAAPPLRQRDGTCPPCSRPTYPGRSTRSRRRVSSLPPSLHHRRRRWSPRPAAWAPCPCSARAPPTRASATSMTPRRPRRRRRVLRLRELRALPYLRHPPPRAGPQQRRLPGQRWARPPAQLELDLPPPGAAAAPWSDPNARSTRASPRPGGLRRAGPPACPRSRCRHPPAEYPPRPGRPP
jgi:hypothetical protein